MKYSLNIFVTGTFQFIRILVRLKIRQNYAGMKIRKDYFDSICFHCNVLLFHVTLLRYSLVDDHLLSFHM